MRSEQQVNTAIEQYADMVRRLCMVHLKNYADTQDIFQNVFLKYALSNIVFESDEHEKAWIVRVTINECKDLLKSFFVRKTVPLSEALSCAVHIESQEKEVLQAVLSLPQKYREVVYLYYYEGYSAVEIGRLLSKNVNTVYTLLNRSKQKLKEMLGGDFDE
ncbi:MAG: sigma-70 family RNA polymerase sigma factor [Ruminococcus sp.]|nr:sigma-70 family RNA polymerase sigma factor [Ruminococcus sp.]